MMAWETVVQTKKTMKSLMMNTFHQELPLLRAVPAPQR
jgi:hypothetical protein